MTTAYYKSLKVFIKQTSSLKNMSSAQFQHFRLWQFDWQSILIRKLMGILFPLPNIVFYDIEYGVPQGTLLGTFLF